MAEPAPTGGKVEEPTKAVEVAEDESPVSVTEPDFLQLRELLLREGELSPKEKFWLSKSVGVECTKESELESLFNHKEHPVCYDGFEPSGRMHIAQGIMKALNVNKLVKCGCEFKFWIADWFAMLNNKMGGDMKKIRKVGEYFIEVWKAAGMQGIEDGKVSFLWTSDEINKNAGEYWFRVMDIARKFNISRVQRCCSIMGRSESDELSTAQMFYPCMQCADIFYLKADICQLGLDQRKVNMLAREYCDVAKPKIRFKPVILSHEMLMGLKEGQGKMSKSDPDSAIFMEDSAGDVKRKIKKAYGPPGVVEANPCLNWCRLLVFEKFGKMVIKRSEDNGGDLVYTKYEDLEKDYAEGTLHPGDLKPALALAINEMLEPVRAHFKTGEPKKLLAQIKKYKTTR